MDYNLNNLIISRIENIVLQYITSLKNNETPVLKRIDLQILEDYNNGTELPNVISQEQNNIIYEDNYDIEGEKENIPQERESKLSKSTLGYHRRIIYILNYIHGQLLAKAPLSTLRSIFYKHVGDFSSQYQVDEAVKDICYLLNVSRRDLGIVAASKGFMYGHITIYPQQLFQYDLPQPLIGSASPITISETLFDGARVESAAEVIIVVEKEGILSYLIQSNFINECKGKPIVICGIGYPSLGSRMILHALVNMLDTEVIGVFDCNPHGINIMLQYSRGPKATIQRGGQIDDSYAVPNMYWAGLSIDHVKELEQLLQPSENTHIIKPHHSNTNQTNTSIDKLNQKSTSIPIRSSFSEQNLVVEEKKDVSSFGSKCIPHTLFTARDYSLAQKLLGEKEIKDDVRVEEGLKKMVESGRKYELQSIMDVDYMWLHRHIIRVVENLLKSR